MRADILDNAAVEKRLLQREQLLNSVLLAGIKVDPYLVS
jgi:hypothetical protein